ncbi:MAG: hypothetical protein ACP5E3_11935, partial [Bacteroidales bacterium]
PYIGSETLDYPVSYFVKKNEGASQLETFSTPKKDDRISNIECMYFLKNKFDLIPGKKFKVSYKNVGRNEEGITEWEVYTNPYNQSYIYEEKTRSSAWFVNDGCMLNFTGFKGNKKSVLFSFYLGFYKIFQAYYKDIQIEDEIPQNETFKFPLITLQDIVSPFYLFLKSCYENKILTVDNELQPSEIKMQTRIMQKVFKKTLTMNEYDITITRDEFEYKAKLNGNELSVKIQ